MERPEVRRRHDFYRTIRHLVKQNLWPVADMGDVRLERTWEMLAQNETVDFLPYTYTYTYSLCPISARNSVNEYA